SRGASASMTRSPSMTSRTAAQSPPLVESPKTSTMGNGPEPREPDYSGGCPASVKRTRAPFMVLLVHHLDPDPRRTLASEGVLHGLPALEVEDPGQGGREQEAAAAVEHLRQDGLVSVTDVELDAARKHRVRDTDGMSARADPAGGARLRCVRPGEDVVPRAGRR